MNTLEEFKRIGFPESTASEINKDPDGCCKEIIEILEAHDENRQTNIG